MKQQWQKYAAKIDALSMRERVMVFGAGAGLLLFVIFAAFLDPMFAKQKTLNARIVQQQNQIAGFDAEVAAQISVFESDPDQAARARLKQLRADIEQMGGALRTMEKGLVAPDKIVLLLENMLKDKDKLRLVSLRTLPPSGLVDGHFADVPESEAVEAMGAETKLLLKATAPAATATAPAAAPASAPVKPNQLLYRHGVEIVLQGSYLDMVAYMQALEAMPTQLFWGKAKLNAEAYPAARLSLTLYTLSLEQKWIAL